MLKSNDTLGTSTVSDMDSIDRALAYHNCAKPEQAVHQPPDFEGCEEVLVRASSILDCAAATAYESADNLSGSNRKVAMGVVHLVELAQQLLDSVLDGKRVGQ